MLIKILKLQIYRILLIEFFLKNLMQTNKLIKFRFCMFLLILNIFLFPKFLNHQINYRKVVLIYTTLKLFSFYKEKKINKVGTKCK